MENNETNVVTIDASTASGVAEPEVTNRPVVKISANTIRRPVRKTTEDPTKIESINPNDYFEKPAPIPKKPSMQEDAFNMLEKTVKRKQDEYKAFVQQAIKDDEVNREAVENGLEQIEGELQYLPEQLQTPIKEEDKVVPIYTETSKELSEAEDEFEEFESDDINTDEVVTANVVMADTYDSSKELKHEDHYEDAVNYNVEYNSNADDLLDFNNTLTVEEPVVATEESAPEVVENKKEEDPVFDEFSNSGMNVKTLNFSEEELIESTSSSDFDIDEEDLSDIDTSIQENEDDLTEEQISTLHDAAEQNLKSEILKKIIQAGRTLDTSQFVVSNKIINAKQALRTTEPKVEKTASWPLMFAERLFVSTPLKGPEIALLADSDDSSRRESVGITIQQAKIMYEHDANPYKPQTFEGWCKTIPIGDVENIFAAMYKASIGTSNYIPRSCEKRSCQYSYLQENLTIDDMVKFDNDESKKKFEEIKTINPTPENSGQYQAVMNVINDKFAISLKIPSLHTILYEYSSLSEEFSNKYQAVISVIQYIDYIYYINSETMQFEPIGWKTYVGDTAKNFKSKIATYSKILKEFNGTEFSILLSLINSMVYKSRELKGISFEVPETKCPKCGSTIRSFSIYPRELVFMRQQLVDLATTPSAR